MKSIFYLREISYALWENDPFIRSEDEPSDSNHGMTLTEARQNYAACGACRKDFVRYVRKPLKNERRR